MSFQPANPTASRKRKAPIDDNGEPVILPNRKMAGTRGAKKKKLGTATTSTTTVPPQKPIPTASVSTKSRASRKATVEDVFDESDHLPSPLPRNSRHIIELEEEEEEEDDPAPPMMDVEDDEEEEDDEDDLEEKEEDDEAELGIFSSLVCKQTKLKHQ